MSSPAVIVKVRPRRDIWVGVEMGGGYDGAIRLPVTWGWE